MLRPASFVVRRRNATLGVLVLLVAVTSTVSCRRRAAQANKSQATPSASSAGVGHPLPPLTAADAVLRLVVRGQADSELLVPLGVTTPQPVVAVIAGSGDLKRVCESLGRAIRQRAFVLCQTTANHEQPVVAAEAELDRVSSALKLGIRTVKRKFGQYVATQELTIVGLGEAAELVVPIARQAPEIFRRVALVEGGFGLWTAVDSARFVGAGGKAILAVCHGTSCRNEAMRVAATSKAAGAAARLEPELEPLEDHAEHRPSSARGNESSLEVAASAMNWLIDVPARRAAPGVGGDSRGD